MTTSPGSPGSLGSPDSFGAPGSSFNEDEMPAAHACAVCGRVLGWSIDRWVHAEGRYTDPDDQPDDHPIVAVPASEIRVRGRCDLCTGEPTVAVLPLTSTITLAGVVDSGELDKLARFDEGWATCEVCTRLVRRGRWAQLLERCVRAVASQSGQPVTAFMTATIGDLHRALRENLAGPPEPLER